MGARMFLSLQKTRAMWPLKSPRQRTQRWSTGTPQMYPVVAQRRPLSEQTQPEMSVAWLYRKHITQERRGPKIHTNEIMHFFGKYREQVANTDWVIFVIRSQRGQPQRRETPHSRPRLPRPDQPGMTTTTKRPKNR